MIEVIDKIYYEGNNIIECGIYEGNVNNAQVNILVDGRWFDIDFSSLELRKKYIRKATLD